MTKMDALVNTPSLDQIATNIETISRTMNQGTTKGALMLGEQFSLAKDSFPKVKRQLPGGSSPRPGWYEWIAEHTRWHRTWAEAFIRMYERACEDPELWQVESGALDLPLNTLKVLASASLSAESRRELFNRAKTEHLSRARLGSLVKISRVTGEPKKEIIKRSKRGRDRFKSAIKTVCQLCETAYEIPVPYLEPHELKEIISELEEAKGHIGKILSQLKGDLK